MPAPIIFFAYNRPELARAALKSLKVNPLSAQSILYIYADGPKENADQSALNKINETRNVLREEQWCGEVHITEAASNKGLAASVISGVAEVLQKHENAIIVEDDVLLSLHFLQFMNDGLTLYKDDSRVFGIGAWTYFTRPGVINTPFFLRYPDSIAWGIFRRSWNHFIYDGRSIKEELNKTELENKFNPFPDHHYFDAMLDHQIHHRIDSWAIRWTASSVLNDALFLYPPVALAKHMGTNTGTHEKGVDYNSDLELADKKIDLKRQPIEENETGFEEWKRFIFSNFLQPPATSSWKSFVKKITPLPIKKAGRQLIKAGRQLLNDPAKGSCSVLLYHRVTSLQADPQMLSVSPAHFEKQMQLLKKKYNVLNTEEFHYHLVNSKRFPSGSIYITFDDGYADNLLEAIPVLESLQIQALFYIATGTLNTSGEFWWDALERILLGNNTGDNCIIEIKERKINPAQLTGADKRNLYEALLPVLSRMPSAKRNNCINDLAAAFHSTTGRATHRALTFDELRKLHRSKSCSIGAHTHQHPSLGALSRKEQEAEINTSISILQQETGTPIEYFSFPFGTVNDYNEDTLEICRSLKFKSVAANYPALVNRNTDALHFPRFLVRDWNETDFEWNLQQFFKA
jgi:peptidoglycan/xylan/chitin deacetylase (PgdA/CDA1 family)